MWWLFWGKGETVVDMCPSDPLPMWSWPTVAILLVFFFSDSHCSFHGHFLGLLEKGKSSYWTVPLSPASTAHSRMMPLVLADFKCHSSAFPGKTSISHFAWRCLAFQWVELSAESHCARGNCICFPSWPPQGKAVLPSQGSNCPANGGIENEEGLAPWIICQLFAQPQRQTWPVFMKNHDIRREIQLGESVPSGLVGQQYVKAWFSGLHMEHSLEVIRT